MVVQRCGDGVLTRRPDGYQRDAVGRRGMASGSHDATDASGKSSWPAP